MSSTYNFFGRDNTVDQSTPQKPTADTVTTGRTLSNLSDVQIALDTLTQKIDQLTAINAIVNDRLFMVSRKTDQNAVTLGSFSNALFDDLNKMEALIEQIPGIYPTELNPFISDEPPVLANDPNAIYGNLARRVNADLANVQQNGFGDTFITDDENAIYHVLNTINSDTGLPIGHSFSTKIVQDDDIQAMVPLILALFRGDYSQTKVVNSVYIPVVALQVRKILEIKYKVVFPGLNV